MMSQILMKFFGESGSIINFYFCAICAVLERVRTRTRTQWVSPSPSPDSSPDSDSTLVDSDSDSDSTSVDSDSSAVDSDSGLMDSDSDSDSIQVDSDSQWVQMSPVRNVHGKFKLSSAIMDEIRGRYWLTLKWSRHWAKRISRRNFLTTLGIYQDYSKTLILTKGKLKNNVGFRK